MGAVNLMGWNEILMYVIEVFLKLLIVAVVPYAFAKIGSMVKNDTANRYLDRFEKLVVDAVDQVQQTYVADMKAENLFDRQAQLEALGMVKSSVLNMMNDRMQEIVFDAVGDFDEYLTSKIEAEVFRIKQNDYKKGVLLDTNKVDAE